MDIEYKGVNCVVLSTKRHTVVVDPKLSVAGLKDYSGKMTVQVTTQDDFVVSSKDSLLVNGPGEYELEGGVSIRGVAAQRHIDAPEKGKLGTMYRVEIDDISTAIIGHVIEGLSESQLESLGMIDVLIVPVGGNGYTLDAHGAVQVIRQVDPKIVIPVHYSDGAIQYEVPQGDLELFYKELGVNTPQEKVTKLKLKASALPEVLTVYELVRTS